MINFEKYYLNNGLKVILNKDKKSSLTAVNILYNVGAKDENENKTGFAHLFEHLMFGGSKNIERYDKELERIGGQNNAFTNNDMTNYYLSLPNNNLETGLWLESDRMNELAFSQKSLKVQKSVVIEEFKQVYLNQPYGDFWPIMRELAYKKHPYKWDTIGKEISHIEKAEMEDVKNFFYKNYAPNNAILSLSGNFETDKTKKLIEKWFASIPKREIEKKKIPQEPKQTKFRSISVEREVPSDAIYMAFHISDRLDDDYYTTDLISDILSSGKSSRFYETLIKQKELFSSISAFITGDIHPGLLVVSGKINNGISMKTAEKAIWTELEKIKINTIDEKEFNKVQNKIESNFAFDNINILDRAFNLSYYELLGNANRINTEINNYKKITTEKVKNIANKYIKKENCNTIYYNKI